MKRLFVATLLAALIVPSAPAAAWDPDADTTAVPADPPAAPADPPAAPEPAIVAPDGVYLVTDIYVTDVTTRTGSTTTYDTVTAHDTPGTYARVLEIVPTGGKSAFDGASFNARTTLSDGRPVAGTYYQDYVLTDAGFVAVNIVFFQDDSETAAGTAGPAATPIAPAGPETEAPPTGPIAAAPTERDTEAPEPTSAPVPAALADRTIEVLRGRIIGLDLSSLGSVRNWRYVSGEVTVVGPTTGGPGDTFRARWDRLAPPGGAWVVRFAIDLVDGTSRDLAVHVIVRSPGLVP